MLALPSELQDSIIINLCAVDLARASSVCVTLSGRAVVAAERRLRQWVPTLPPGSDATVCWLRSLGQRELATADAGARPSRSWRDEYVDVRVAVALEERVRDPQSHLPTQRFEYEEGGELHPEAARTTYLAPTIAKRISLGWTAEEALMSECLCDDTQGAVLHRKNRQFPASVHAVMELFSELARRSTLVPEPKYNVLEGRTSM